MWRPTANDGAKRHDRIETPALRETPRSLGDFKGAGHPEELEIPAGLQDRVIQTYEGAVYMDFDRETVERTGHGLYEPLDPALLPPLYVAYRTDVARSLSANP